MAPPLPSVIVPVHNAATETAGCLESLLRTVPAGSEVLLLDDASHDPAIQPLLRDAVGRGGSGWRLHTQARNLGFVVTANCGIAQTRGDVVLLNSDTVATAGWLEGLRRCLDSDSRIATATPWTNNGEIASLPRFCANNPAPPDAEAVARIIHGTGRPGYPDLPTAVGFCMAISRRALDLLGGFDEARFGLGYGEENEFSMRAAAAGLRNVLCDDVYVVHLGGRSFGPRGLAPGDEAMRRLLQAHPDYLDVVGAFIAADPLAQRRQELLAALAAAGVALG